MAVLTVRSLADEVVFALKMRAKAHGRSTEAEVREILRQAVMPVKQVAFGAQIQELAAQYGVTDAEVDALLAEREVSPAVPRVME
jgi:plasmid stability protein